jgi:hypothetical protein
MQILELIINRLQNNPDGELIIGISGPVCPGWLDLSSHTHNL